MESYKSWLKSCVKNKITLDQMMFLYLIKMKDFMDPKSWSNQYVNKVKKFNLEEVIEPLIERGWLMNLNKAGEYYPEFMMTSEDGEGLFATQLLGEEFWDAYPMQLPIGNGGKFISRAGIEKGDFIDLYLRKIDHDPMIHVTVMRRLKVYEGMVISGEINGHKIGNWVNEQLRETIPDVNKPKFGTSV
jgi:hypothetical protein